jgi:hypothetical protein
VAGTLWVDTSKSPPALNAWDAVTGKWEEIAGAPKATAPVIGSVTLADSPEAGRFTSGTFRSTVVMADQGLPVSTKGIKAHVMGTLKVQAVTSEIVGATVNGADTVLTLKDASKFLLFGIGDAVDQDNATLGSKPIQFSPHLTSTNGWAATYLGNPFAVADANPGNLRLTAVKGGSATVKFVPPLTGVTHFEVRGGCYAPGNAYTLTLDDGLGESHVANFATQPGYAAPPNLAPLTPKSGVIASVTMSSTVDVCGFLSISLNGKRLFDGIQWDVYTPSGLVKAIDPVAKTITLSDVVGTWGPVNSGRLVMGKFKVVAGTKLFCKLSAGLTVTDLQSADPGFTSVTGNGPYTVTFPATLPSGQPPDTDLPAGTSITTEVEAMNATTTVDKASNTVIPA